MNIKALDFNNVLNDRSLNLNTDKKTNSNFESLLKESLSYVNQLQKDSETHNMQLATGQIDNLHEVMIATEKADVALQITMTIRNKIMDAYNEIMRMQV